MADRAEIHQKIRTFLMTEWARKDERQLVGVDLLYAPVGYREEVIRPWERADEPELFSEFVNVEKLADQILEIAEGEADAKPSGKHRFIVRTRQHMGSKPMMSFALSPSFTGDEDSISTALTAGGGGVAKSNDIAAAQILSNNNGQLMRINAQMFDSAFRPLAQQNAQLLTELIAARAENSQLQRKLAEAEANKMDREFQIAMAAEKNARANAGIQKIMQLGTVLVSKFAAGTEGVAQLGEASPLPILIGEFYQSLRSDQMGVLMQTLDMAQKIMFMEIVNLVKPPEQKGGSAPPPPRPPGGANGAPTP